MATALTLPFARYELKLCASAAAPKASVPRGLKPPSARQRARFSLGSASPLQGRRAVRPVHVCAAEGKSEGKSEGKQEEVKSEPKCEPITGTTEEKKVVEEVVTTTPDFEIPEILTETLTSVKTAWEETEEKPAVVSLAVSSFIFLLAAAGVLKAIDSLPIAPFFFEVVGIGFSGWFAYRYLLFKPDREELKVEINNLKKKIIGS